jgi:6-phosphogluconolactonase
MSELLFYVGSYASKDDEGISLCRLDGESGRMEKIAGVSGVENPSFLAVNRSRTRLYAACETTDDRPGSVASFAIDPFKGGFTQLNEQSTLGAAPCHVALDGRERFLVAVNYNGGNVCLFPVAQDGALGAMSDNVRHEGRGPRSDRQEKAHPHSSIIDPANGTVIVADLGTDKLAAYRLDSNAGRLVASGETAAAPASGPRHMALHPNGRLLYVVGELNGTVSVYRYGRDSATLDLLQTIGTIPAGFDGSNTCADIHVSADGRFLYASNRGHDSIAVYRADDEGRLELIQHISSGGRTPRNFALSPDGRYLLAANQDSDSIALYSVNGASGRLVAAGQSLTIGRPVCIKFA